MFILLSVLETRLVHVPVLLSEFLEFFDGRLISSFLDMTLGAGGHALAVLDKHPEVTAFSGIDRDPIALEISDKILSSYKDVVKMTQISFKDYFSSENKELKFDGMLADLGVSSMQMDDLTRGFSFKSDGPLDMRMDPFRGIDVAEVLNTFSEKKLGEIFRGLGEEPFWRRCAKAIVSFRQRKSFKTVVDLRDALRYVFPPFRIRKKIHPLTLVFQALRMFVNDELGQLSRMIIEAVDRLNPGGRLVIISFCSLEDRIVKNGFRDFTDRKLGFAVNKKVIMPSENEIRRNPRCRSAKMRCFEKRIES